MLIEAAREIYENVFINVNGNKLVIKEKAERVRIKTSGRSVVIDKIE